MIETDRLIIRPWSDDDIAPFAEMNRDRRVMENMPKCLTPEETEEFYRRIVAEHQTRGYGLYAVALKDSRQFIGYTGFHRFDFDVPFAPGIEIGWRLAHPYWGHGYATEAAKACIEYARRQRLFDTVYSFTAICNHRSERVMQKIGMTRRDFFNHPALPDGHRLKPHVLYILDLNGS